MRVRRGSLGDCWRMVNLFGHLAGWFGWLANSQPITSQFCQHNRNEISENLGGG